MKFTFVLDNVRSAFNVGSIFRTADGLNFDIHLIGITPIPGLDKKLDKTSLSALDFVDWKHFDTKENWFKYITILKDQGNSNFIISIEETDKLKTLSYFDLKKANFPDQDLNIYIILGHEINGVDEFLMNKSDLIVKIPMFGKKNSLNVATCAGVIGYKIRDIFY